MRISDWSSDVCSSDLKDRGQIFRVDVDTIESVEAAGDYMCIKTGDNTLILRETMKDLEKRLDPRRFQRVHRSTIVNLDLVRQVKPHTRSEEHTSELQSLMRISYAVFFLKKKIIIPRTLFLLLVSLFFSIFHLSNS